jgi:hypothetical protein
VEADRDHPATARGARFRTSPPSPTATPATPTTAPRRRASPASKRSTAGRLVGGTSAAAPLTAAGIALADQYAEEHGEPTLGFLNPLIYQLGASAETRATAFYDVTVGDNNITRALDPTVTNAYSASGP